MIDVGVKKRLTYATVCSGIECMSVACRGLPLDPVFFSEIEPYPCAVLKARYPKVPNLGDMSKIQVSNDGLHITNGMESISLAKPANPASSDTPKRDPAPTCRCCVHYPSRPEETGCSVRLATWYPARGYSPCIHYAPSPLTDSDY